MYCDTITQCNIGYKSHLKIRINYHHEIIFFFLKKRLKMDWENIDAGLKLGSHDPKHEGPQNLKLEN